MAYNESGELPVSQSTYSLGGYTFELKVQTVHEPGEEDVVSVFAICRSPDGSRETQAVDFPVGTEVESWSVEANETEATVYALVTVPTGESNKKTSPLVDGVVTIGTVIKHYTSYGSDINYVFQWVVYHRGDPLYASNIPGNYVYTAIDNRTSISTEYTGNLNNVFTYAGKTVYYTKVDTGGATISHPPESTEEEAKVAWTMVYGTPFEPEYEKREALIGRFAIDLRDANGGPDGDWDEPGDTGDPEKTLYVSVVGATAGQPGGRIPLEPETAAIYGNGGTGGNGGGGGAGASTVIIYDFATDKAGSVVQAASSRGPSGRSSGGDGGRGADGCILIFY